MITLKKITNYISRLKVARNLAYLPGHFYSPVVMPEELEDRKNKIFSKEIKNIVAIDLNEQYQCQVMHEISSYYSEIPFTDEKINDLRYYYNNIYFSYNSGIELFGIIRHFKPKKIIEVGSGFSSALMLDTNEFFFNGEIKCKFIEPYPKRFLELLKDIDVEEDILIKQKIQEVDLSLFKELQSNDILFIDSSHVSKTGSDLNHIIFEILPILNKGVIIHFHDVYYPFEYPIEWAINKNGFGWNEIYILRSFLMYNNQFSIIFMNSFLELKYKEWFVVNMPKCLIRQGGSLYLKKN
jgi:predicted O-methyltransferase YrrM